MNNDTIPTQTLREETFYEILDIAEEWAKFSNQIRILGGFVQNEGCCDKNSIKSINEWSYAIATRTTNIYEKTNQRLSKVYENMMSLCEE